MEQYIYNGDIPKPNQWFYAIGTRGIYAVHGITNVGTVEITYVRANHKPWDPLTIQTIYLTPSIFNDGDYGIPHNLHGPTHQTILDNALHANTTDEFLFMCKLLAIQ